VGSTPSDVTVLLRRLGKGDSRAEKELFPLIYSDLRRRAASYMRRERKDHTLTPTALVHEAYLKLACGQNVSWRDQNHFFAVASQVMRRVLIDHARSRLRAKRGAEPVRVAADEAFLFTEQKSAELLALHEALIRLAKIDARQSKIVELRYFGGLKISTIAQILHVSPETVKRDWSHARLWLFGALKDCPRHEFGPMEQS